MVKYRLQISNDYSCGVQYYFAGPYKTPAEGESPQQINIITHCEKTSHIIGKDNVLNFINEIKNTLKNSSYKDSYTNKLKLLSDDNIFIFVIDVGVHKDNELSIYPDKIMEIAHVDEEQSSKLTTMNRLYVIKREFLPKNQRIIFTNNNTGDTRSVKAIDSNVIIIQ